MGSSCCYFSRVNLPDEDEDIVKSIVLEVINVKVSEQISTNDSVFNIKYQDMFSSSSNSF